MSNSNTITGKIVTIMDEETFPSGFYKRAFVVETGDKYPNPVKIECIKDKCDLLNGLDEDDVVTVHYDLRGREYQGRYFTDVTAWKIEREGGTRAANVSGPPDPVPAHEPLPEAEQEAVAVGDVDEDLPF